MNIAELIDGEVMKHIELFGCVKNMDPFALHMLKTSQHPILRGRRIWMRRTALQQVLEATRRQEKINDQFKREPAARRGATVRRAAVLDPYFAAQMPKQHGTSWNDKGFVKSVREGNPKLFPKRE